MDNVIGLLPVMPWSRREFAIPHRAKLAPQGMASHRKRELIPDPLRQISKPPAHNAMGSRNGPSLDLLRKPGAFAHHSGSKLAPVPCVLPDHQDRPR